MSATSRGFQLCAHLARAVRQGRKTASWRPLSFRELDQGEPASPFSPGEIMWVAEPYGELNGARVPMASLVTDIFKDENQEPIPDGFVNFGLTDGNSAMLWIQIDSVELAKLDLAHRSIADTGMVPIGGGTAQDEFARQWGDTYRGAHALGSAPMCWLVKFHVSS